MLEKYKLDGYPCPIPVVPCRECPYYSRCGGVPDPT